MGKVDDLERECRVLRADLSTLTTAIYCRDQVQEHYDVHDDELVCPECGGSIMYMPNDCDTCRRIGAHVTEESVDKYLSLCKAS